MFAGSGSSSRGSDATRRRCGNEVEIWSSARNGMVRGAELSMFRCDTPRRVRWQTTVTKSGGTDRPFALGPLALTAGPAVDGELLEVLNIISSRGRVQGPTCQNPPKAAASAPPKFLSRKVATKHRTFSSIASHVLARACQYQYQSFVQGYGACCRESLRASPRIAEAHLGFTPVQSTFSSTPTADSHLKSPGHFLHLAFELWQHVNNNGVYPDPSIFYDLCQ